MKLWLAKRSSWVEWSYKVAFSLLNLAKYQIEKKFKREGKMYTFLMSVCRYVVNQLYTNLTIHREIGTILNVIRYGMFGLWSILCAHIPHSVCALKCLLSIEKKRRRLMKICGFLRFLIFFFACVGQNSVYSLARTIVRDSVQSHTRTALGKRTREW